MPLDRNSGYSPKYPDYERKRRQEHGYKMAQKNPVQGGKSEHPVTKKSSKKGK